MISKTEEFRRKVAESRQLADNATSPYDREHWLRMTEHWSKMFGAELSTEPAFIRLRRGDQFRDLSQALERCGLLPHPRRLKP
jgi:hypothetical protein